jgi:hypothetical protein
VPATLRYTILCNGEVIGSSDLEDREPDLGVAAGRFEPTDAYARVAPVFRLFAEAHEEARARLVLEVREADGPALQGAGVAIIDVPGEAEVGVEVYFATPRGFAQL